jgi:hypothetical protein
MNHWINVIRIMMTAEEVLIQFSLLIIIVINSGSLHDTAAECNDAP